MAGTATAKRKAEEAKLRSRPYKKFKKQTYYSSGSDESSKEDGEKNKLPSAKSKPKLTAAIRDKRKIPPEDPKQEKKDDEDDDDDANDVPMSDAPSGQQEDDSEADSSDGNDDASRDDASETSTPDSDADSDSGSGSGSGSDSDSDSSNPPQRRKRTTKRHDPSAFASSMSAILASKAGTRGSGDGRADPVLSRSRSAAEASHSLAESRLEARARRKLRDERRAAMEKGRVRDVLLGDRRRTPGPSESEAEESAGGGGGGGGDKGAMKKEKTNNNKNGDGGSSSRGAAGGHVSAAEIAEQERRLRKTAQRGVVKLFNAVRAAQVKGEEAAKQAKEKGVVGMKRREETVNEMSRKAFLDLVGAGKIEEG